MRMTRHAAKDKQQKPAKAIAGGARSVATPPRKPVIIPRETGIDKIPTAVNSIISKIAENIIKNITAHNITAGKKQRALASFRLVFSFWLDFCDIREFPQKLNNVVINYTLLY